MARIMTPHVWTGLLAACTQALDRDPLQAEVLVRRGMAHHHLGDRRAAIADYTAALAIAPIPEAHNNRGVALQAERNHDSALGDFDAAIRLRPDYAEAWINRGVSRHARSELGLALADFDHALRLRPDSAEAWNNRGVTRQALDDLTGAHADFSQALHLVPDYVEALDNRGTARYLLWKHAEADADFTRALDLLGPAGSAAVRCRLHVCRGDARYHAGSVAGLVADYAAAFRLDPDRAAALIVERLAKDAAANFRLLLANCDKHLLADPGDFIVHARRGLVHLLVGQDAEAQADFDAYYRKRRNPPALTQALIEAARRHRERHGVVTPGDTPIRPG